jgi:hypothetical protein
MSFWLVAILGPLHPLRSGRFGSTHSGYIARNPYLAEPHDSRLQPHAAAYPPGTIVRGNYQSGTKSDPKVLRPTVFGTTSQC